MSADNWTTCPRCTARSKKRAEELMAEARASYGQVSASEYEAKTVEANAAATLVGNVESFREDYEIWGAREGVVHVGYSGNCATCGLSFTFDRDFPIPGVDE